jgi:hypothetical protein
MPGGHAASLQMLLVKRSELEATLPATTLPANSVRVTARERTVPNIARFNDIYQRYQL